MPHAFINTSSSTILPPACLILIMYDITLIIVLRYVLTFRFWVIFIITCTVSTDGIIARRMEGTFCA